MAKLIPKVAIDDISVKSERDTARCLVDQLPNDCIIYHSYPWLNSSRNDRGNTTLKEGETDFVIILPSHGVLVLEVKGGVISYDDTSRNWSRVLDSGHLKPIQDPFEQARRNMHYLEKVIKLRGYQTSDKLPFTYGYAVVFPDCDYQGRVPVGAEPAIIFSASDLDFLSRRIITALSQWSRSDRPNLIEKDDLNKITKAISPKFDLLPVLFRKIEEQEEKLFRLTQEQLSLLAFLGERSRACIEGVAGSGKTMLAQAKAQEFADKGKSVLFVCYNKTLANWINSTLADEYKSKITVKHFHGLCAEWAKKAGMNWSPTNGSQTNEFWRDAAGDILLDAIDYIPQRFDAVIVDEGQDFYPNWWMPLEMINREEESGPMYVFFDPKQNLYIDQKGSLPALGEPLMLPTNCRNTQSIAQKCSDILDVSIATKEGAPVGDKPLNISFDNETEIKNFIKKTTSNWLKGKLTYSQIAILSPNKKSKSAVRDLLTIDNSVFTEDVESWKSSKGILYSTIKNFKGLEADAVILVDIPLDEKNQYFKTADYYVACSRAKHLLIIVKS